MASHELILADAMEDGMNDRPLRRRLLPAALCLRSRQADHCAPAQVGMERAVLDKYAAPDALARLADALQRSAAKRDVHGRLAFAAGPGVAAGKMTGRRGA